MTTPPHIPELPTLSTRQRDVLALIADGYNDTQIAHEMKLTHDGVRFHIRALFKKFGVSNRAHLIAIVLQNDLLSQPTTPFNYTDSNQEIHDTTSPTLPTTSDRVSEEEEESPPIRSARFG